MFVIVYNMPIVNGATKMSVEHVYDSNGHLAGSIECESGYGVHARCESARRTFLTNGYRAAIGSEDCTGMRIQTVKRLAREWARNHWKLVNA